MKLDWVACVVWLGYFALLAGLLLWWLVRQ